ncbi:MAG TPA: hypothetical protein VFM91_06570 [Propionibacteriaceae bacterium]|nr:hypothetical protein [Propionibacteriaceae bacterium]
MVFVPMTWDEAAALRSGTPANRYLACAATPRLVASMEADTVTEEAEYAALSYAGVLSLSLKPGLPRLLVAAEVRPNQLTDLGGPLGEVEVRGLAWDQVRSLFGDESAAFEATRRASEVAAGESLTAALAAPEVGAVLDEYDLLWFAPEELDQLQR